MGLETGDFIADLVKTNPLGTDPKSQGDDHIRLVKRCVQQSLPGLDRPVTLTAEQLNSFAGMIAPFPVAIPEGLPTGWLYCSGQEVSRDTYPQLYALLGDTYGSGDGSTTFNLPDYRGEFLRGQDDGAGIDLDAASRTDRGDGVSGDAPGTKQDSENLAHDHPLTDPGHQHGIPQRTNGGDPYSAPYGGRTSAASNAITDAASTGISISSSGGSESRPINVYVRYYIHI